MRTLGARSSRRRPWLGSNTENKNACPTARSEDADTWCKKMKSYYQAVAPDYARYRRVHPQVLRCLITTGPVHADSHVLEIGCGTGNYICALRESVGCHCWGIDPSEPMLAQAIGRSPLVRFACGSAESLAFSEKSFDLAFSVDVVHHITDRSRAFSEAVRVLRPGGRLCLGTDSGDMIRNRHPLSNPTATPGNVTPLRNASLAPSEV
jgi:ubiquinone/menaquinone biosynthesis C-methylase UbiE